MYEISAALSNARFFDPRQIIKDDNQNRTQPLYLYITSSSSSLSRTQTLKVLGREAKSMAKLTAMNSPLSLLIFSLALRLLFFTKEAVAISLEAQKQREFDYFALALQWPGSFCQRTHHCCSQNGCCRPEPLTGFTIHGLWPDYYDGTWPSCCSRTEFDIKKVSSLLPTLDKYWPTLSCGSTSQCDGSKGSFWGHEWGKHGTCSYPLIQDEYSYFSKALELYFKYNITEILNSAGFLASNSEKYPLGDIVATVKKAVGATPQVVCKSGSVQELRICFNKDFKPIDCINNSVTEDDTSNSRNSCPRTVRFPTYGPLVVEDVSAANAAAVTWFS